MEGEPMDELAGAGFGEGLVAEGVFILEAGEEGEGVLAEEPVAVATEAPLGEVCGGDGAAVEVGGEEGLDFGEGIEPVEEGWGQFAVVEAVVELFADGVGEAGDFAGAGHRH